MTAFSNLIAGYGRFRQDQWPAERSRWAELLEGQSPRTMVIACSDSRVDPAQIFDTRPGEIFVVRNVAALVPPYETTAGRHGVSAAVEFAVLALGVSDILVMGHGRCGGCAAALHRTVADALPGEGGFVAHWVDMLDEARAEVAAEFGTEGRAAERAMEEAAVKVSLANLMSFPFVAERVEAGTLRLRGGLFAIADGILYLLDEDSGRFAPVDIPALAAGG